MPIKDINELLNMTIVREKKKRFSERIKPKVNPKYTEMGDVVPPLGRGDFLHAWRTDRKELAKVKEENEKIVKERDKLKKAMQTTYSRDWPSQVSAILNEGKDEKEKK
jgi:hypothetical protein